MESSGDDQVRLTFFEYCPGSGDGFIAHEAHQLSPVAEHPETTPEHTLQESKGKDAVYSSSQARPRDHTSSGTQASAPGSQSAAGSHITWRFSSSASNKTTSPHRSNVIPTSRDVWTTNAPSFAQNSHPNIHFLPDLASGPRANTSQDSDVERRHRTEPVARSSECNCTECDAQRRGLLSREMVYAYLAMRGAQGGEDRFGELMARYKESGDVFPSCPHAAAKCKEEQRKVAKRTGKRPAREPLGALRVGTAGPSSARRPGVILDNVTDFNEDNVSDGGDVDEGSITPNTFLRMASGVSGAETEKPLPPLPSDVGLTHREKHGLKAPRSESSEKSDRSKSGDEGGQKNETGNEDENDDKNGDRWEDRVDGPGFRTQVCEDTMEALTGSYTVSSAPSMINEPPGVRHLGRLRGAFGTLFSRMQPRLAERLDRVRLGLHSPSDISLSIYSEGEYTAEELESALASPSATPVNNIPPSRLQASLAEAERRTLELEKLEAAAHESADTASNRLALLRSNLARIASAATYVLRHRTAGRHAKIRRTAARRLHALEYRRARALDGLRHEEVRRERDLEAMKEVRGAIEQVVETVGMEGAEEVVREAEKLWDEDHGRVRPGE